MHTRPSTSRGLHSSNQCWFAVCLVGDQFFFFCLFIVKLMKINICYAKFRAGSGKQNKMWVQVHILVTQHNQTWHLHWFAGSKL
jgi:hypothetical protein